MPTPTKTKTPGRKSKGILTTHQQISVYLKPELIAAVDRQADLEEQRTGHYTARQDIIRKALLEYLARHGAAAQPEAL
jgi:metal-responsive CopG/Arc/MetJ family transcriptional regulator